MTKTIDIFKQRWLLIAMMCFLSLAAVSTSGCAGKTRTSTVTTQTTTSGSSPVSTSSVTTKNERVTDAHPRGVIGGIFYTVGQVIVWPFKVLGSLFS